ncbi:glycosyltransferase [Salinivibrio kushneri]|uniref:glycosyltransferase n=1 Tax=Salinivibrio kushneri TaxID=1908198 RepID=UPI0022B377BF|nr:glycosyltransferase [Salinivibrio kushneri]WBA10879.1 glycosyltransferase [Salinivibrio kushneri]
MKKIVFVLPNLDSGGVEKVALNYLNQLDAKKYNVTLIVFNKTDDLLHNVPDTANIICLHTKSTKGSLVRLVSTLKDIQPDVVYTGHSRVAFLVQCAKLFVGGFKHLARMQSMPSLEKKYRKYGLIHRKLYATAFRNADVVLAETTDMKDDAISAFSMRSENIKVMHNPLNKESIDRSLESFNVSPFIDGDIVGVASGRLCKDKGYDILIMAIKLVLEEIPNFKLYILGRDDGEGSHLKGIIKKQGLDNKVILEGFKKNPYRYYNHCDLFILSSRREGFPNVVIENYYLNTPIVSTRCVPIINEIVVEGCNGYTCEVEDIISLSQAIVNCIKSIKRSDLKNPDHVGSKIESLF